MPTLHVISDLHIGPEGGPPMFAGGGQIQRALSELPDETELVLNGDTFDLLALPDQEFACTVKDATRRLDQVLAGPDAKALAKGLRAVVDRGGSVLIRSGNHDLELGMPEVQEHLRKKLDIPSLAFDTTETWSWGGGAVVVEHGEATDDWNRFRHGHVPTAGQDFRYPPGSRLVRDVLNPARVNGLPFLDALKPDFWGAALAALALEPELVRHLPHLITLYRECRVRKRDVVGLVGLDPLAFGPLEVPIVGPEGIAWLEHANRPWNRARDEASRRFLRKWRREASPPGDRFFELAPMAEEWDLARRHPGIRVHIAGHTHAARWGTHHGLTVMNAGTWTWLVKLPGAAATVEDWHAFTGVLRDTPPGPRGPYFKLFTAARVEAVDGRLHAQLVHWTGMTWAPVGQQPADRSTERPTWGQGISLATARATAVAIEESLHEWDRPGLAAPGLPPSILDACRDLIRVRIDRSRGDESARARDDLSQAAALRDLLAFVINQRRDDQRRELLQWADAIAQEGWALGLRHAGLDSSRLPPVVVEQAVPSPLVWSRDALLDAPGLAPPLAIQAPFPLIILPPDHMSLPWRLLTVLHEVGHLLDDELDITPAVWRELDGLGLGVHEPEWRGWTREIVADFVAIRLGGPRYADVLHAVMIGLSTGGGLPAWDHAPSHPPPTLRLGLLEAWGVDRAPCRGWRRDTSESRQGLCDQVQWVADAVRRVVVGGVSLEAVLAAPEKPWCRFVERGLSDVDDLGALEAGGRFPDFTVLARGLEAPKHHLDPEQERFLASKLSRLSPTYGRSETTQIKAPPIRLLRRFDRLIGVGATNDQLERQMEIALHDRHRPWDEVELFFLSDDAAMESLYPGEGRDRILARDAAIFRLHKRFTEDRWARRWTLWLYPRTSVFASFWSDAAGHQWHAHVSSPVWGRGIRDAPSTDYQSTSADLSGDPEIHQLLGGLPALRKTATLVASSP